MSCSSLSYSDRDDRDSHPGQENRLGRLEVFIEPSVRLILSY